MIRIDELPVEWMEKIRSKLKADETVLWYGRPSAEGLRKYYKKASLVGIFFIVFSVFWIAGATVQVSGNPDIGFWFPLTGVPFLLAGIFVSTLPMQAEGRIKRMLYVVTDRRLLILGMGVFVSRLTIDSRKSFSVEVSERGGGRGNVSIHVGNRKDPTSIQMLDIPDVKSVVEIMRKVFPNMKYEDPT